MQTDSPIRRVRREIFGCTQEQLAEHGRVSRSRVCRYESAGDPPPYEFLTNLLAAARQLGLQLDANLFFAAPPAPSGVERRGDATAADAVPDDVQ